MSNVLDRLVVAATYLELTFKKTPQSSSLKADHFKLASVEEDELEPDKNNWESTPIANPFKSVVLANDYNSLSRTLKLTFNTNLDQDQWYRFTIDGVKDAAGKEFPVASAHFEYTFVTDTPHPDEPTPVIHIQDFSIKKRAFLSSETILAANPDFYITNTNPDNNEIFVEEDHNRGRIIISFSRRPNLAYINKKYIKVQRKQLNVGVSRWETINTKLKLDSATPRLYAYVPSLDEDMLYDEADRDYFENGYKYRVRISGDVAAQG